MDSDIDTGNIKTVEGTKQVIRNFRTTVLFATLLLFSLIYFLSFSRYGVNLLDEGYLFNPALRILTGELPGRDYYHFYPPGRFYLFSWLFALFGTGMATGKITLALFRVAEAMLAWSVAKRLTSPGWAIPAWLGILICPGPAHKVFFGMCVLGVLLGLDASAKAHSRRGWFLYGLITGVILLIRHDVAAFGAILGCVAIFMRGWEEPNDSEYKNRIISATCKSAAFSFWMIFGIFVTIIIPFAYWAANDVLGDITHQMFSAARTGNKANAIPYPLPMEIFGGGVLNAFRVLLYYMPIAVYIATAIYLIRLKLAGKKSESPVSTSIQSGLMLTLTLLMGVLCLNQARVRSDLPHLYQALAPVFILAPALCYHAFRAKAGKWRQAWFVLAAVPLLLVASQTFSDNSLHHGTPIVASGRDTRVKLSGGDIILSEAEASELTGAFDFIVRHSKADEPILVVPDAPLLYFLADRRNPTPFELMRMGRFDVPESERRVVDILEARRPALVVYRKQEHLPKDRRFDGYAPQIEAFIMDNYRRVNESGSFYLLLPKSD